MSDHDASLSRAAYEAGKVGRRAVALSDQLTVECVVLCSKAAVSKARVFKVFASHIAP